MERIREYLKERNIPEDSLEANSILEGYEKSCKDMIEKACEWLKFNTNWDDEWDDMGKNMNYGMIEEFRKAMEE
jgi:hypothetical protein